MQRLVYSPRVDVFVKSDSGVVDLSPYVTSCTVSRKLNQVSRASVTFRNPNFIFTEHPYKHPDGKTTVEPMFHPMDPIVIVMERMVERPVQVFTGYCDTTPYLQLYPGTATIEASCTLKRLLHTYWDPGLPFVWQFLEERGWAFNPAMGGVTNPTAESKKLDGKLNDASLGQLLFSVLEEVGGWHPDTIRIEELPQELVEMMRRMFDNLKEENDESRQEFLKLLKQIVGEGSPGGSKDDEGEVTWNGPKPEVRKRGQLSWDEAAALALWAGWSPKDAAIATALTMPESTRIVDNDNGICCVGLWQINTYQAGKPQMHGVTTDEAKDPYINAQTAYKIWKANKKVNPGPEGWGGMNPWQAYGEGKHRPYLEEAREAVRRVQNKQAKHDKI